MSKVGIQLRGTGAVRTGLRGGGIAKRGTGAALKGGGRAALRFGGGRTNLLEELGRVEGEHSNRNRRDEIARVHSELNRGYKDGGRIGFKHGTKPDWKKGKFGKKTIAAMKKHDFPAGGPHQSLEGKKAALRHASIRAHEHKHGRDSKAEGGRIGFKKGTDKNWIQKATASIKKRGTKGKCTPITKKGCTGRAKALAKTFKKMAAKRKA